MTIPGSKNVQQLDEPISDKTLAWLMTGDPAIRWQTKRDLLDATAPDVEQERSRVATTGWGHALLGYQDRDGTWGGGLYGPKWTSTAYTLLLLRWCGLPSGNPSALRGAELIWDGARYFDGGLTSARSIDAPEACVTSMYVALAHYYGFVDPRVDDALDWLLANQLDDGGWNCRTVRFGDSHSSFHVLRALDHFQRSGASWDNRLIDALDLLSSRRRRAGTWPVQNRHTGNVWFDMEKTGGSSRWNTLRALRVQKWAAQAREGDRTRQRDDGHGDEST